MNPNRQLKSLSEHYLKVRKHSEYLCAPLHPEDFTPQSAVFASPPKWHLAHTSWFFEELLLKAYFPNYKIFDDRFSYLFNSYYNSLGQRIERGERGLITRPSVEKVFQYRKYVDDHMETLLSINQSEEVLELVELGLNHEQQHQELLITDLKYTFSKNPTYPEYEERPRIHDYNEATGWLQMAEGIYEIGAKGTGFCYDNELGRHKVYLEAFEVSKALVTNGEFIEFIEQGGYETAGYWLDEGWSWVNQEKLKSPMYWIKQGETWFHYTLAGLQQTDPNAILSHISFYEAAAFAFFKGCRLATEFEWEAASDQLDWGKRWEWTNSAYLPYPRFKIAAGAVGEYNGKFMVNQMVLRGASVATSEDHSRNSYRNFFHPHLQWQFTGIRLAR